MICQRLLVALRWFVHWTSMMTLCLSESCKFFIFFIFYFFIKCMQSMTMTLSKRCAYVRLHVSWSKSLLYIFSLINHIDSLHKQVLSIKQLLSLMLLFSCLFMFFSLYSSSTNSWVLISQSLAANHHVNIVDIVDSWLDQRFNQTLLNYVINLILKFNSW